MKCSYPLLAVASLCLFTQSVHAQSSVVISGVIDNRIAYGSGSLSKRTSLANSGAASSQITFRGVEQLGNGLKVGFWLEAGLNTDDGNGQASNSNNQVNGVGSGPGMTFNRRSTVSIGGDWGELRFGREYLSPQYFNLTFFDPFNTLGTGANQMRDSMVTLGGGAAMNGPALRPSNSISYAWNHGFNDNYMGTNQGFSLLVEHYMGENPSGTVNRKDGTGNAIRVGYNRGPLMMGLALSKTSYLAGDQRQNNFGMSYNFEVARVFLQLSSDKLGAVKGQGYLLGVTAPVGKGMVRASYSHYKTDAVGKPATGKLALGYVHNLSRRTAVYTTVAHAKNSGTAAWSLNGSTTARGKSTSGFDLGIRHIF